MTEDHAGRLAEELESLTGWVELWVSMRLKHPNDDNHFDRIRTRSMLRSRADEARAALADWREHGGWRDISDYDDLTDIGEAVKGFLRGMLRERLAHCTEEQQAFFNRMNPDGIDSLPEDQLRGAIGLCERTIVKNNKGRRNV